MKYVPHDYQTYAIEYIKTHPISAVLLDMGLGKTSITLTALNDLLFDSFETHRVLVIAPLRVASISWPSELSKWDHLQNLKLALLISDLQGADFEICKNLPDVSPSTVEAVLGALIRDGKIERIGEARASRYMRK